MSDLKATGFIVGIAEDFLAHARAIIGEHETIVVRLASWTEDGVELDYVVELGGLLLNGVSRDIALDLLARTYKRRSSRVLWGEWLMPGIPERFQFLLEERFPVYRRSSLEVGPGWLDMLWALAEWLEQVDPGREPFMQVKEKFGSLRLYGPVTDAGEPIVEAAELLSGYVCEICGKLGRRVTNGGLLTLCDDHASA